MEHYFSIFIAAMLINNVILSQFLGICPFLGVSKKMSTAVDIFFDTPKNGQIPRNCDKMTLFISMAAIKIEK